jgi:CheY-like chemotaxis protein
MGMSSSSIDPSFDDSTLEERRRKLRLDGLIILVVEDTRDARDLIRRFLVTAGAEVHVASSADEARKVLENVRPDALISDIGMPKEDGISFIEKLRESEKKTGKHIPAIALTAFVGLEHRSLTLRAGFEEHLCKPTSPESLIDTILRVVLKGDRSLH